MAKKKKFYVVWRGHQPGIYDNWQECQAQVKNFPNAEYKSFRNREEAEAAYHGGQLADYTVPGKSKVRSVPENAPVIWDSWSVDAACSGNPGRMEYRGVHTRDRDEIFHFGPVEEGTNNIGEFLAIVHALALLKKGDRLEWPLYTDSRTAISWVRKKKANTKLTPTSRNRKLFELIRRAEKWLRENTFANPIHKWDTDAWGEIPADFGRK